jgi:uncharacterized protein (DUF924 family)
VRQRFLSLTRRAIAGELDAWDAEPTKDLALVLLGLASWVQFTAAAAGMVGSAALLRV